MARFRDLGLSVGFHSIPERASRGTVDGIKDYVSARSLHEACTKPAQSLHEGFKIVCLLNSADV